MVAQTYSAHDGLLLSLNASRLGNSESQIAHHGS